MIFIIQDILDYRTKMFFAVSIFPSYQNRQHSLLLPGLFPCVLDLLHLLDLSEVPWIFSLKAPVWIQLVVLCSL